MLDTPDYLVARELLLRRVTSVGTQEVALGESAGRVLAADLIAGENIPPFDRSPYDGYAFIAGDTATATRETPVTLSILEEIAAGAVPTRRVTPGTAAKVLTGAPIPDGADAVMMFEETAFTADTVTLFAPCKPGQNIVRAGEDVKAGTVLANCGDVIDAGTAGTLAAQGIARPVVYKKPRIGIISTGNEVIEADEPLAPGKIRNANRHALEAILIREGMESVYLGLAGDRVEDIARLIEAGLAGCDALVLTGGVSVGDYDLTPAAMEACGVEMLLRGAAIKPGMACAYGMRDGKLICGLSGNPASSITNLYMIALPALRRLAGRRNPIPQEITVTLKSPFGKKSRGTRILRGRLDLTDGTARMVLPGDQGNVVLSSAIGCDVMVIVPAGTGKLESGTVLKGFVL